MAIIKGVFRKNSIELLEPVKAKEGTLVEVIFRETDKAKQSFIKAFQEELSRMEKGFPLGGGPYYKSRSELYER